MVKMGEAIDLGFKEMEKIKGYALDE